MRTFSICVIDFDSLASHRDNDVAWLGRFTAGHVLSERNAYDHVDGDLKFGDCEHG